MWKKFLLIFTGWEYCWFCFFFLDKICFIQLLVLSVLPFSSVAKSKIG